jgi:hypothetical protein
MLDDIDCDRVDVPRRICRFRGHATSTAGDFPWRISALQLAPHHGLDHPHARLAVVEAGDRGKVLAAGVVEIFGVLAGDLFERFQAVGGFARAAEPVACPLQARGARSQKMLLFRR